MDRLILGIDAGNHKGKVAGIYGTDSFKTNICNWFERDVQEVFGSDDMEFSIDGRKGFAGSIAEAEDEFGNGTTYGETKAHDETKIRILLAIHRYIDKYNVITRNICIVTGQPINNHKDVEKNKIINMLIGSHEYVVNGTLRKIYIEDVKVTPEGSGAFWSNPKAGLCRVIDIGSGTVNMATVSEKRHIHKSSGTMNTGMETVKNKSDLEGVSRAIFQHATRLKWKKDDPVYVCGGISEKIYPNILKHFPNAEILTPLLKREFDTLTLKPIYANAVGFYHLAKGAYQ